MSKNKIRWGVFLVPWLLLLAIVAVSFINNDAFVSLSTAVATWIVNHFSWMISGSALLSLIVLFIAKFTKVSKVRLGGSKAQPIISKGSWYAITLTTTVGSGLLYWATCEPLVYMHTPPKNVTAGGLSGESITWAFETLFMNWTWFPYALYTVAALVFAFVYYNMKHDFSLSALFAPLCGPKTVKKISPWVDGLCLFTLACGVAGAFGTWVLNVSGGMHESFGVNDSALTYLIYIVAIMIVFLLTSISGIKKGISKLADLNMVFFYILGALIIFFGPISYIVNLLVESYGAYLSDFFRLGLLNGTAMGDDWAKWWPVFYMCVWLAWTPMTAIFLGRIGKGYTVGEFITANLFFPVVFSTIWLGLFAGSSIYFDLHGAGIYDGMMANGYGTASYNVLRQLPLSMIMMPLYVLLVFLSFATTINANTTAMAGLCMKDMPLENPEPPTYMKVIWGVTVSAVTYIFVVSSGIDGVKMVSNLGGLPSAAIQIIAVVNLVLILRDPKKYDVYKEDYDELGNPLPSETQPVEGEDDKPKKENKILLTLAKIRE